MTEEEAKTKWCPAFRGNDHGINRPLEMENLIGRCLGSACMAWRWLLSTDLARARACLAEGRKIDAIKALREAFPGYGLLEAKQVIEGERPWPSDDREGFCGLAGAPQ